MRDLTLNISSIIMCCVNHEQQAFKIISREKGPEKTVEKNVDKGGKVQIPVNELNC